MLRLIDAPEAFKKAVAAVEAARAAWQAANEIDKETKNAVLAAHEYLEEGTKRRITVCTEDYLMSETDFKAYCELVYQGNLAKGLDSGGADLSFWPLQKAVYDAENALIDTVVADIPHYTPEIAERIKRNGRFRTRFFEILGL